MGAISISMLGAPRIDGDVSGAAPKGKKVWGLLAYLLLTTKSHSREHLAELLFSSADDPLGALRWNLSQLRKLLQMPGSLRGRDLELELPPGTLVDVHVLSHATWSEAMQLPNLDRELLEGLSFPADHVFDSWLMVERARLRSAAQGVLQGAASACLGTGRFQAAADLATRAVALDPFDEGSHEMLIRALVASGHRDRALEALHRCTRVFREELGREPSGAIRAAVAETTQPLRVTVSGSVAAHAQLELGRSAIKAGAVDTGIESLRVAAAAAEEADDEGLVGEILFALAYALIHSVRGRDGEASSLLHGVQEIAERMGSDLLAAQCLRELGYIDMLVGRYDRALVSLERAVQRSADDLSGTIWTLAYQAICYSDTGRYPEALRCLERCFDLDPDGVFAGEMAYVHCLLGRLQLQCGQREESRANLERAIELATRSGWVAFVPWPQALLAELDLLASKGVDQARKRLDHALSVAQQMQDPCWEAAALHGLSLVEAASEDTDRAADRLLEASALCTRFPDSYLWMRANVLDALCDIGTQTGMASVDGWIADLQALAARTGMNEFLAKSYLYMQRRGDERAASSARLIAGEVDNPALVSFLERSGGSHAGSHARET